MSSASGHRQRDERDQELEWLRRLVRDLELKAKGWRQRRDQDNRERRDVVWEIGTRSLVSPILINAWIVPFLENHADTGTAHTSESLVNAETIHARADMPTVVRIPRRNDNPTMLPWTQ